MTAPVRAIIFDKDGTLFDFRTTWEAWAASFLRRVCGGDTDHAIRAGQAIGFDYTRAVFARDSVAIAGTMEEIAAALAPAFPGRSATEMTDILDAEAARAPQAEAVPLRPYLTGLRARGLHLGVATNDSEAPARAHLETAGVIDLLDFIAGADSGHGGKPAPGQLLAFCATVNIGPENVLMVGDSSHDLMAGRAAGMRTVGVLTGMASETDLAPKADIVLPDIGAIPGWLDRIGTR
ncbi:MAG: HAD family hydrolase [Pseudomonadota bacterium]